MIDSLAFLLYLRAVVPEAESVCLNADTVLDDLKIKLVIDPIRYLD